MSALSACLAPLVPAGRTTPGDRTVEVHLTPEWQTGRLVQAPVNVYTVSDVATIDVVPLRRDPDGEFYPISAIDGATVSLDASNKVTVSVSADRLASKALVFKNLRPATVYRFQARAVDASGQTLSIPGRSFLDLELGFDDRPVVAGIPVQLKDRLFSGTGTILLRQVYATRNYDSVLVELFRMTGQDLIVVPGATASFPNCTGKMILEDLEPHTTYWAQAKALAADGRELSLATASLVVTNDDRIPDVSLDVVGGEAGAAARMAPDDPVDPSVYHDYTVVKNGVSSAFVWVPVFEAYQLIVPGNCGAGNTDRPVGYWVANRPSSGVENEDWARETFGGFYAGKYEASHADAIPGDAADGSGATKGSSSTLKVAQNSVPWTNVNWDEAVAACQSYDPACHLMEDDEWTVLAVWSMIRGVTVYGNNSYGKDTKDTAITFRQDLIDGGRALTGTGTKSGWSGSTNLTTHTGTTGGVYDLNGNVGEWTATLGGLSGSDRYTVKGQDTGVSMPEGGYISSLSTVATLRRYGVPGTTSANGLVAFGQDLFWHNYYRNLTVSVRGSSWYNDEFAGVWSVSLQTPRSHSDGYFGFRPVLRFSGSDISFPPVVQP